MTELFAALRQKSKLYARTLAVIAAWCTLTLWLPAPASASTAAVGGGVLHFAGAPAESTHLTISFDWTRNVYLLEDSGAARLTPGSGCTPQSVQVVSCAVGGFARVDARLGNGPSGFAQSKLSLTAVDLHAGDGRDTLIGGGGADTLEGGGGDDTLTAGTGNTTLVAGSGPTTLQGGPGKNSYQGGPGSDLIFARNGVAEQISCTGGMNSVVADPNDTVSASCASVDRGNPQPLSAAPPVNPTGPSPGLPPARRAGRLPHTARSIPLVQLVLGQVAVIRGNAVPIRLSCPATALADCAGTIELALAAGPAPKPKRAAAARRRKIVISRPRPFRIARGKSATFLAPLWRSAASLFHGGRRSVRVAVTISFHTELGASRQVQTLTVSRPRRPTA